MSPSQETSANINLNAIAEHLNLSTATVSRALRNVPGTHPRTKSLVMNAAAELGYRPQRTRARTSDQTKRKSVGVLVYGSRTLRTLAFLEGMTQAANDLDLSLVLQKIGRDENDAAVHSSLKKALEREENLTGVVLIHRWPEEIVRFLSDHFDCLSLVHQYANLPVDVVDMNHVQGMTQLADHLHDQGHRKIGFMARNAELSWAKARFGGYSQALFGLDLPYHEDWIIDLPALQLEDTALLDLWKPQIEQAARLVEKGVTAWMASSDWAGYVLCKGLTDLGFNVPQDVSITGFDTDEAHTLGCPRMTSVIIPKQEMGVETLRRLLRRSDEPQQPQHVSLFGCAFSPGQTTAPPQ